MTDNQQHMWDKKHSAGEHAEWKDDPRPFAREVAENLQPHTRLLELGCGVGSDARFFANHGVDVVASDFSQVVIDQNNAQAHPDNLEFTTLDITDTYPFADELFDAVYAHLSLHYYNDETTRKIFTEIHRVLKPEGMLYFNCKSTHDPSYGQGEQIEPDMFVKNHHIRHFFSPEYTRQVLANDFDIVKLEETEETYADFPSNFINCWARHK